MWADTTSPVAFAPPPAARFQGGGGSGAPRKMRLEENKPRVKFVLVPNAYGPTAFTANIALVPLPEPKLEEAQPSRAAAELAERISFLRVEAERENIPFSEVSRDALWSFLREFLPTARPRVYLNDNGNLRALWKNSHGEQVGLEFLGAGTIQFVIFRQRAGLTQMARVAGVESEDRIFAHIRASNAQGLLFA